MDDQKGEDNLTAKEYLQQARSLDMLINAKQDELYALRLTATSVFSPALGDKVKSGGTNNTMQIVDKIIALQETINREIDRLVDLKAEMREKIARVYNPQLIAVLTDKYINGFTLEQIAERMDVAHKTVYRLHGQALQVFRKENNMI